MKCPTCYELMKGLPIYIKNGVEELIQFICSNDKCESLECYMSVTANNNNCYEYSFCLLEKEKFYFLRGRRGWSDSNSELIVLPETYLKVGGEYIIDLSYFIPISTGDNMHKDVWRLFHRLKNMVIYS